MILVTRKTADKEEIAPEGHHWVAIGQNIWGTGATQIEAVKNAQGISGSYSGKFEMHITPDTHSVDEMGGYYQCNRDKNCPYCK